MRPRRARRSAAVLVAAAAIAGCGATAGRHGAPSTPAEAEAITVVGRERLDARLEEWT